MKNSFLVSYPARANTLMGTLLTAVPAGFIGWFARGMMDSRWQELTPAENATLLVASCIMLLFLLLLLMKTGARTHFLFQKDGVKIMPRFLGVGYASKFYRWDEVEAIEPARAQGFPVDVTALFLKIKKGRKYRLTSSVMRQAVREQWKRIMEITPREA